jgi:2,3-diketo-5-methylthiopentyl-1-phosphate enolase
MHDLGTDVIIGAGGAMHGHPGGLKAGVVALKQAIEATMEGKDLKEAAIQYKELEQALNTWGVFDPKTSIFELTQ